MTDRAESVVAAGSLRLDKWLWFARVVKSRTLAAGLVEAGKVRVNRVKVEKPSHAVRVGDVLTVTVGQRVRVFEIAALGVRRGPAPEAQALYVDRTPPPPPPEAIGGTPVRDAGQGRPTKRDRRRIDRLTDDG